jgi:hypothetical protein
MSTRIFRLFMPGRKTTVLVAGDFFHSAGDKHGIGNAMIQT